MKHAARRLLVTACCLVAAGTLIFPTETGATLTQPLWPPKDPETIPKPPPAPANPKEQDEDDDATSADEETDDSPSLDPGKASPSPTPAHPDRPER